jgi:hypothetical protein
MKHKAYYDEEHGMVCMEINGEFTSQEASELLDEVEKLLEGKPQRYLLNDVSKSPNVTIDRETRKLLQKRGAEIEFDKMAFVGVTPMNRMMAKIVMAVLGKSKDTAFFDTSEDALSWLKGE